MLERYVSRKSFLVNITQVVGKLQMAFARVFVELL